MMNEAAPQHRTAVHEAGHAVVAKYLGARVRCMHLHGATSGDTNVEVNGANAYADSATIAVAGNRAVAVVIGEEAAKQERDNELPGFYETASRRIIGQRASRRASCRCAAPACSGQAGIAMADALAEFEARATRELAKPSARKDIIRVAEAILAADNLSLFEEEILALIEGGG